MDGSDISWRTVSAWGNLERPRHLVGAPFYADEVTETLKALMARQGSVLPFGLGRSYGDSCLNENGGLLVTNRMDRLHAFDATNGLLRADAGLSLAQLNAITVPLGWIVPVTPGTKYVTLGGAVANDVHGKNHHLAGSFGHHVRRLGLMRHDGDVLECSADSENDLLRATIGGLGLTGLILWVEIALTPITSSDVDVEHIRFGHLDAFFELSRASAEWTYTVAWIDCLSRGARLGRGIFSRGRHAPTGPRIAGAGPKLHVPLTPPIGLINGLSVRAFNTLYYNRMGAGCRERASYDQVLYPLDGIGNWNRIYGPRGFYQYQCTVPPDHAPRTIAALLKCISAAGMGSFLVVLKNFGGAPPAGLLSFPSEGTTLALDFPNHGSRTLQFLDSLDEIVRAAGGRLYPAKDARMSPAMFRAGYPGRLDFERYRDPVFTSDFWRRVNA